jgi:hypothetical protein
MYEILEWREIELYDAESSTLQYLLENKDKLLLTKTINLFYYNTTENHEVFTLVLQRCKNVKDIRLRYFTSRDSIINSHEMMETIPKENLKKFICYKKIDFRWVKVEIFTEIILDLY